MTHVRGQDWGLSLEQGVISSSLALRPAGSPRQQTLILGQNIFICKNIDYPLSPSKHGTHVCLMLQKSLFLLFHARRSQDMLEETIDSAGD